MNIKPIRTEKDYRAAMKRIDELIALDPKEGTALFDELDVLSTIVESYESIHYPIEAPNPIKAIQYIMEEQGLNQKDLVKYFSGSKAAVSSFLNGRRELSKKVIKSLHEGLGIPYEIFMG